MQGEKCNCGQCMKRSLLKMREADMSRIHKFWGSTYMFTPFETR